MFSDDVMDTSKLSDARTALIYARLQLRGAKRRFRNGHTTSAIVALYDSVLFGMRYYISKHKDCASFVENIEVWDAVDLFQALTHAGVFEDPLVFNRLSLILERALWQGWFSVDTNTVLEEVEEMLTKLGILQQACDIPLKESSMP